MLFHFTSAYHQSIRIMPLYHRYSYVNLYRCLLSIAFFCAVQWSFAQQTEFIPKSKKDLARDAIQASKERKRLASSGINTVLQTKYVYKFGKVENAGIVELATRYNAKGFITRSTEYNPSDGKIVSTISYRYDANGNLVEELLKKEDKVFKTVHRYNSKNHKIETVYYKEDGFVDRKISYVYDETGLLLEAFGRLDDGKLFMRDSYLYDAHGNVIEFKNSLRRFVITYDRKGNILTASKYQRYFKAYDTVQYNLQEWFAYEYDGKGQRTELRSYRADSSLKSRVQYIINEAGQLAAEREFGADGRLVYSRDLKYDKQQNLIEESGSDRALKFRHAFKYDQKGNKTEWIAYDQIGEPVSMTKFTFGRFGANAQQSGPASPGEDTLFVDDEETLNNEEFFQILGARIIAPDGTYLGMVLADTANPQSIINSWGQYGFSQSPTSIFNSTIPYGGENGIFSPFNAQCPSPPSVYKDGKFFTYLTDNDSFRPRSAPRKLIEFLKVLSRQN